MTAAADSSGMPPPLGSPSRAVWAIALPAALTNVATALFGLADMWVIGRLGDAPAQGAVELGAKFMMGLLISFNFLRTGTIALTAQAAGRGIAAGQTGGQGETLARAIAVALAIAAPLMLAMPLIVPVGLGWLGADGALAAPAREYVTIRYWASPAWLLNAALTGWLIGQRRVRTVLAIEVGANLAHIALDVWFVLGRHWGVAGVATATVMSELLKLALLSAFTLRNPAAGAALAAFASRTTWRMTAMKELFALNRDLFVRTLLLTGAMMLFARAGAKQGAVTLAANGILFQMFMLATMLLDGFESAAQVLCGEAKGSRQRGRFVAVVRAALAWGMASGVLLALIYFWFGGRIAASFSTDPAVRDAAVNYVGWVALLPLLGAVSFVLDGVFVGGGWTRAMLLTMAAAMAIYLVLLFAAAPLGNTGLWLAFAALFLFRAVGQVAALPGLVQRDFGQRIVTETP